MNSKRNGILSRLFSNSFVKSVVLIASGTAGAQAIGMLAMPFITRLYGPEAFGILGAFTAVVTAVIPISAFTYPIAIVLAKTDKEARELGALSLVICVLFSCLVLFLTFLLGEQLSVHLKLQEIGGFIYLTPLVMIFAVLVQIARQWSIRKQRYKHIANTAIIQALAVNGSKLIIGLLYPVATVLVITYVFGQLLQAVLLLFKEIMVLFKTTLDTPLSRFKDLAKKYYDFPLYRAPQVTLNAFSESMPVLFFTTLYGPAVAGYYSLARVSLGIPAALIGQSVSDVFYPRFVKEDQNRISRRVLLLKATIALGIIGFLPYAFIFALGPWIFSLVFGDDWLMAGEFARWLSFWLFARLISRPAIASLPVLNLQRAFLVLEIIWIAIGLGIFLILSSVVSDVNVIVIVYSMGLFLYYVILILLSYKKAG